MQTRIINNDFHIQDMAKRAKLTTQQVLESWESFDTDIGGEVDEWEQPDNTREPVMPGSDDEFSDLEENLVEEEENHMELETEIVQDVMHGETSESADMEEDEELQLQVDENTQTSALSPLQPRDGITWSPPGSAPPPTPFTAHVGATTDIPESPLDAFLLTFTPNLISTIVTESNRYAKEVMAEEKYSRWEQINEVELRAYLGFSILMAINHVPALEDYWKRDPVLRFAPIADRISRGRFRDITRYLHFRDNSTLPLRGSPGHDRLGKVRPVLSHLCQRFAALYDPPRALSVDEAMIKFQGRSSLKQYMPMKPVKRGIKVWVLADSVNGYFSRLEVYSGKQPGRVETGLGSRVVRSLTADFSGKNHLVAFDNFFTSYDLLEDLLEDGVYACGTARKDRRGFPVQLKNLKLKNR